MLPATLWVLENSRQKWICRRHVERKRCQSHRQGRFRFSWTQDLFLSDSEMVWGKCSLRGHCFLVSIEDTVEGQSWVVWLHKRSMPQGSFFILKSFPQLTLNIKIPLSVIFLPPTTRRRQQLLVSRWGWTLRRRHCTTSYGYTWSFGYSGKMPKCWSYNGHQFVKLWVMQDSIVQWSASHTCGMCITVILPETGEVQGKDKWLTSTQ